MAPGKHSRSSSLEVLAFMNHLLTLSDLLQASDLEPPPQSQVIKRQRKTEASAPPPQKQEKRKVRTPINTLLA
jgi:hypothetical protein